MPKTIKEFQLNQSTGEVSVEYSDDSTSKFNAADMVTAQTDAVTGGIDFFLDGKKSGVTVSITAYGAAGDAVTDDAAIAAAINALPAAGGTVIFPEGIWLVSSPISDLGKRIRFVLSPGAQIKPTVDNDVFRLTTYMSSVVGGGIIDGSLISSGAGCGVVVGYGGSDAGSCYVEAHIKSMPGIGLKWENGSFLRTDVIIQYCSTGGFLCTSNYDDNNHGDISAHIASCGYGFKTEDSQTVALRSRSHHFRNLKTFGCTDGVLINTEQSYGAIFSELNTNSQITFAGNGWGNTIFVLGANGEPDVVDASNRNLIIGSQGGGYNYTVARSLVSKQLKVRDRSVSGSLVAYPSAAAETTISNDDETNVDHKIKVHNKDFGSGKNIIFEVDKLSFARGSGTIDRFATALVTLNFGTVGAGASVDMSTGFTTGAGATAILTWADATTNMPSGLILQPWIDKTSGTLYCRMTNITGAGISVNSVRIRYAVMTHF